MSEIHTVDTIAIGTGIFFGLILFAISTKVFSDLYSDCPSKVLKMGWTIIQATGLAMVSAGLYFMYCTHVKEKGCYTSLDDGIRTVETYAMAYCGLFLLTLIMGIVCVVEIKKIDDADVVKCKGSGSNLTQSGAITIIILSAVGLGGAGWVVANAEMRLE